MNARRAVSQSSADRLLVTFLFSLVGKVWKELQGCGGQRESAHAAHTAMELLKAEFTSFRHLIPFVFEDAMNELWGFKDGYPYTYAAVAASAGKSQQEVIRQEAECLAKLAQIAPQHIIGMREVWLKKHPCKCDAKVGEIHRFGCDMEECPFCHSFLSKCMCAYKHLKLGDGGLSKKEWKQKEKLLGRKMTVADRRLNSVRLTAEQERQWAAIVLKKGCIPYGSEKRFQ